MSFILDAIAKSERERQQQEMPGPRILALPASHAPPSRGLLPFIVIGALLLNAAVLVAWIQSGQPPLSAPSQAPPGVGTDDYRQNAVATDTLAVPDPAPPITIKPEATKPEHTTTADDTGMDEPLGAQQDAAVAMAGGKSTVVVGGPTAMQSETLSDAASDEAGWIRIGPDTLSNRARSGQPAAPEPLTNAFGALPRKVSSLGELPAAVRDELPKVVFSGHLYSSDPDSSIVFVDEGRPVTQGRQIVDELYLREITPGGVIVEFRGYLIDVGVLQNWTLN